MKDKFENNTKHSRIIWKTTGDIMAEYEFECLNV